MNIVIGNLICTRNLLAYYDACAVYKIINGNTIHILLPNIINGVKKKKKSV